MKIALIQYRAIKGDINANVQSHLTWIDQAVLRKADLVVFPELSLTGYEPQLADELATSAADPRFDPLQARADTHQITIAAGLPTRSAEGLHISLIIFRPHLDRITYSKQYLHHSEVPWFVAAHSPLVLPLAGEVVAPAICFELSIPEHHAYAMENGATVYMASTLNSINGVATDLSRMEAFANRYHIPTLMNNFVGTSGGYDCGGKSSVWNSKGVCVAQLSGEREGMIVFDTCLDEVLVESDKEFMRSDNL
jgi:predicted amidohydrolase